MQLQCQNWAKFPEVTQVTHYKLYRTEKKPRRKQISPQPRQCKCRLFDCFVEGRRQVCAAKELFPTCVIHWSTSQETVDPDQPNFHEQIRGNSKVGTDARWRHSMYEQEKKYSRRWILDLIVEVRRLIQILKFSANTTGAWHFGPKRKRNQAIL